ncbi:hypothetical protein DITRI_Ditri11bG0006800 [Diplodiscus trichospermus]
MVVVQASKINLPATSSSLSSSKTPTSLLFDPHSFSLALFHSDSSVSLFPSISFPFSFHQKCLTISPPSSSFTFLLLQKTQQNPNSRVIFIVAGPYKGGSKVLLRFFLHKNDGRKVFEQPKVVSKQKGIDFDDKVGVSIDVSHGLKVMIVGSVNFFALYSLSSSKILIFGVKLVGNDEGGEELAIKLMKCAVIDCLKPVFSMSISFECLVLGEENGVSVWNLRELVKGKKVRRVKNTCLSNGVTRENGGIFNGGSSSSEIVCYGYLDGKIEKKSVSVKQMSGKYRQESAERGACFVVFEQKEVKGLASTKMPFMSMKAISIQPLSSKKFLILNSSGDLSVLHVLNTVVGSNITCHMRPLPHVLKVQKLAVLPDISSRRQTIWISDGYHSVHMMDISSAVNENDKRESEEKPIQVSVSLAIFSSEKIQGMMPTAANSILILGQGSLDAYTIS